MKNYRTVVRQAVVVVEEALLLSVLLSAVSMREKRIATPEQWSDRQKSGSQAECSHA